MGSWVQGLQGLGFRVQGFRFECLSVKGFMDLGPGFRVERFVV